GEVKCTHIHAPEGDTFYPRLVLAAITCLVKHSLGKIHGQHIKVHLCQEKSIASWTAAHIYYRQRGIDPITWISSHCAGEALQTFAPESWQVRYFMQIRVDTGDVLIGVHRDGG